MMRWVLELATTVGLFIFGCVLLTLVGCSGADESDSSTAAPTSSSAPAKPALPEPTDPALLAGKATWSGTCARCHRRGVAGAPKIGSVAAWEKRVAQGKDVLYEHALNGFEGPGGGEMPARGGNPDLSDAEVQSAVDYMVWAFEQMQAAE